MTGRTSVKGADMRAVWVREFGAEDTLTVADTPDPRPGPGEVLIEVAAAGVNRADLLFRSGRYHSGPALPAVPGSEGAGTVVAVGPGVAEFALGDRVLAWGPLGAPGFYRELAVVDAGRALPVPADVSLSAAAALPVAWLSAWYCLHRLAEVRAGETVLVYAAASGVGSAAVQIAKDAGARVIAVVGSAEKQSWVRELGADETLDHSFVDVATEVGRLTDGRGAEVALDLVGGDAFSTSVRSVGRIGRVVALANVALAPSTIDTRDFYPKNVTIHGFQITDLMQHGWDPRPDLRSLLGALAERRFTVPIDATFPLDQAAEAHRRLASRITRGKIVLTPASG
ncbi:MAG TPA: NADPH:quinone oxidoreductase family protein [Pseudonocardiaceae bacterium]|nr:NADPH:quinone oxidoreductase family protein [Pseudonocardiaceae bacterium]